MRKLALAAGLVAAVSSAASWAGGIQIAIEGDGDVGNSAFIFGIGNTEGNSLLDGSIIGLTGGGTTGGIWRGHNSFDISAFTGFTSELTIDFSMAVDISITGASTTLGTLISATQTPATIATFDVYYDDFGRLDSDIVLGAVADAITGLGYTDGVLVASGSMTLGGGFTISNLSGLTSGDLSVNDATQTITTAGGTTVAVDFLLGGLDLGYVVNGLSGAIVDLSTANSLTTPFDGVPPSVLPVTGSSALFSGGTIAPDFGADGENDFDCGALAFCDFQSQMNTTILFVADSIPEPGTVALMGIGLALFGRRSLRSKK